MVVTQFKFLHCHVKDKYQFIKKATKQKDIECLPQYCCNVGKEIA